MPIATRQSEREGLERGNDVGPKPRQRLRGADQQRAVERPIGDGIRSLELPAGEVRLHDLEAVCHPVDCVQNLGESRARPRGRAKPEDDLGFDLRLGESAEPARRVRVAQEK